MKEIWKNTLWMFRQVSPFKFELISFILIQSVIALSGVGVAFVSKYMIDSAMAQDWSKTGLVAGIFVILIILKISLNALQKIRTNRCMEQISNTLRLKTFQLLARTEWRAYSRYNSNDLITRMNSDIDTVTDGFVYVLPNVISLAVGIVVAFSSLLMFEPVMAVLVFVLGPAGILFSRFFGRRLKALYLKIQDLESVNRAFLQESLHQMNIVKAFNLERDRSASLGKLQDIRLDVIMKRTRLNAFSSSILSVSYWLGYFLAFGWGVIRLAQGETSFGTFTAFLQLVGLVQKPVSNMASTSKEFIPIFGSAERLTELEKLQTEDESVETVKLERAGIFIDQVRFAYEQEKYVLNQASVEIEPGEIIAVMGSSGEGKTTLTRLLLALLYPVGGHIYFTDGRGSKYEAGPATRRLISYVPQGHTLFSGTVADNLRTAEREASDEELKAALAAAGALDFVLEMPEQINTLIGENSLGLSEGQAQRLAIARALLRKAPVLLLDEATSALDLRSETKVLEGIKMMKPQRTCLVITHRLTALRYCDRVILVEDGRIREGNKEDIIKGGEIYED